MKTYTTPIFVPIRLEETTMAKGSCKIDSTQAEYQCAVYDSVVRGYIFDSSNNGCTATGASAQDRVCYHVPIASHNIYAS